MKSNSPTRVGIAVVERNLSFLVGARAAGKPLAGYSEFPGGKCHSNESSQECARRECLEETGIDVQSTELLLNRLFVYDQESVDLDFWLCHLGCVADVAEPQNGFRWVSIDELGELSFPAANDAVIAQLQARFEPRMKK